MSAFSLVADGKAMATIAAPVDPGRVVSFAISELIHYVERISRARLTVASDVFEGTGSRVIIGTRDQLKAEVLPEPKTGFDGYCVVVDEDRLVIAGENERGVLYGVYDVLERLGCRWYYPQIDPEDPEIVPTSSSISIEPMVVTEAAGFEMRVLHPSSMIYQLNVSHARAQADWATKARYNAMAFLYSIPGESAAPAQALESKGVGLDASTAGIEEFIGGMQEYVTSGFVDDIRDRGMLLEGPLHCMIHFMPNALFEEHPEWFGMDATGQRGPQRPLGPEFCWSNADAVQTFAGNVRRWLEGFPHLDVFAFTPNDGGSPCRCPECAKSTPGDLYAGLANAIRDELRAAGIDTPVEITGGYPPTADAPSPGVLHPEIRVHWAHWGRPTLAWYGDPEYGMRENLDTWLSRPNPFTMVEYYPDGFASPPIHQPVATPMGADNAWLLDQGVFGNFQLLHPQSQWWNYSLAGWLGITFYYSDRDPRSFLDDYSAHYFGAAAAPMTAYHRILDGEQWLTYFCCGGRWTPLVWADRDEAARAAPLLDELERLIGDATRIVNTPVEKYRLGKVNALFTTLAAMGRARIDNIPLIHDIEAARTGDGPGGIDRDSLTARIDAAEARERDVINPMIGALNGDPRGLGSDDLVMKLTSPADLFAAAREALR